MDNVDTCPNTPSGQSVDANGCSNSQKDTDGDGVMDNVDTCPNTPSGEAVDASGCSNSQKTYVPDNNFEKALIDLGYDDVLDDYVLTANINTLTSLKIFNKAITNLTGIEDFIALETLNCAQNQLNSLDVSNNTALTYLWGQYNQLNSLNISNNTALTYIAVNNNQLTSLNVSNNTALTYIGVNQNQLTSLDVSNNTALTSLSVGSNQLTSMDVSNNTALTSLSVGGNQLTSIDVSQNTALTYIGVNHNQLTSIDVSQNTALTWLNVQVNQLTSLDVSNNTALEKLYCYNNQLNCIQVNQTQLNAIPTIWSKDATANYSLDCSIISSDDIQGRLNNGETPNQIYQSDNSLLSELYGKIYRGGVIFKFNTSNGTGLLAAPQNQTVGSTYGFYSWGCVSTLIGGTSAAMGTGQDNTNKILNGCSENNIAARICDQLVIGNNDDWYLPSKDELHEMYLRRYTIGGFNTTTPSIYWSSTEYDSTGAWIQAFHQDIQNIANKDNAYVRAISSF
ncbi:DUF1566 domain-containing protein [Lutibacter sp. A80]|nr:DUF1566 domain-containing protein [Lutibacter sp. A80]